jgi:hypothetical protein
MKLRSTLLVSALVALSACGGSSDTASRNRNGLLDATSIPGAGTTIVLGATTLPTVATTSVPAVGTTAVAAPTTTAPPQAPTTTSLPVLIPVPTSNSTIPATTTTIARVVVEATAKTFKDAFSKGGCGTGGMCKISVPGNGEKGPKGGWIIGVSEAGFATKDPAVANHFLEMGAPVKVQACNKPVQTNSMTSQERTKELLETRCITTPALQGDWYIPGDEEIQYVLDFSRNYLSSNSKQAQPFREAFYQKFLTTSTTCGLGTTFFYPIHDFISKPATCLNDRGLSVMTRDAWITPVRSFGPTIRACAVGGPCKTGDIGPNGGIVVNSGIQVGTFNKFFEAMTSAEYLRVGAWCGPFYDSLNKKPGSIESGRENTASLFNDGTSGLPCDVVLSNKDITTFVPPLTTLHASLFVPAAWELKLLCTATQSMKRLDSLSQKQCGISRDFKKKESVEQRRHSDCPVSIYCTNERGEFTKQVVDFVWTSSPVGAGKNLIMKEDGTINGWSFGESKMTKRPMYRIGNNKENTSRGITLPFREFTALVSK